jgi:ADP-heptose:LPS heptosyltransferase
VCIVPRWDTDHHFAAAVACFSGAPRRVGHTERSNARKAVLNAGFDRLYTDVVTSLGIAHEVERHLALLDALGAPRGSTRLELSIADADRRRAHDALGFEPDERPLVAFGIGAAHAKRRWPIARFAELGRELQRRSGVRLVIVGGAGDVADQQALVAALGEGVVPLAGRLTLRETAAVLERSRVYVGNDSAPMHLAVAMDTPCVEISCHPASGDPLHANAPERFGPWLVPSRVIRPRAPIPPCTDGCHAHEPHCILGVDAERVLDAAGELLEIAAGRVRREPGTP